MNITAKCILLNFLIVGVYMDRILKKITKEGDFWIWTGCVNTDGYPKLARTVSKGVHDFNVKGHRYVYEQTKGEIPEGKVIRHKCDNRLCLNPDHLEVGTPTDNMMDRQLRGRTHNLVTPEQTEETIRLRQAGLSQSKVAKIVECSQTHISKMELGRYTLNVK